MERCVSLNKLSSVLALSILSLTIIASKPANAYVAMGHYGNTAYYHRVGTVNHNGIRYYSGTRRHIGVHNHRNYYGW